MVYDRPIWYYHTGLRPKLPKPYTTIIKLNWPVSVIISLANIQVSLGYNWQKTVSAQSSLHNFCLAIVQYCSIFCALKCLSMSFYFKMTIDFVMACQIQNCWLPIKRHISWYKLEYQLSLVSILPNFLWILSSRTKDLLHLYKICVVITVVLIVIQIRRW
jgi:hypothetical protein